jgi:N-acyl-D-aspartate/D-glutamate deacylase
MRRGIALLTGVFVVSLTACQADPLPYDLVITNARIVDGSGNPWYRGDVAIQGGQVVAVGRLTDRPARRVIDAGDRVVAPGFIDMMGGSSTPLLRDPATALAKLTQGITTMMVGEGGSDAPQNDRTLKAAGPGADRRITWHTFGEYFRLLEGKGIGLNLVHNVGAAQVRLAVLGEVGRAPTAAEMDSMKALVVQAMRDGAIGLSTALIYPPGSYATTEELIELSKAAAPYGGAYFSHMRNESAGVLGAIREVIRIGREAGIPVHIYHLKAAGKENWPLMARALALIQQARDQGVDLTAYIYPYIRNVIGLGSFVHPKHYVQGDETFRRTLSDAAVRRDVRREIEGTSDWENWYRHVGQNWDNVLIVGVGPGDDARVVGLSVQGAAKLLGKDVWQTFFDLVQRGGVSVNPLSMNEEQKQQAMRAPFTMFDTDAEAVNPDSVKSVHPRAFGTFPRILAKYVRDEQVIPLEEAIRKMTSLPADRLKLYDRGRIAPGMAADLVVFDPDSVQDLATDAKPLVYSRGMDFVLVNGVAVIDGGRPTRALPGLVLRRR